MLLYINKEQYSVGGGVYEGEEDGPYATREPTYVTTVFTSASFATDKMFSESVKISDKLASDLNKNKKVYLGVIFYSDGDTFGTTYGLYLITGVSTSRDKIETINKKAITEGINTVYPGYKPWEGYFSNLIGAEIFDLPIV